MKTALILNIIGYVGSALVLISFLMASVLKLRIVNIAGSVASVIYSLMIHAYPTVIMNAALIVINLYYIRKMLKQNNIYHVVETKNGDSHLKYFIDYYRDDIKKYFPEFDSKGEPDVIKFVYCESNPVSIFAGKKSSEDTVEVLVDYSIPAYRDCSVGKYIYENLAKEGVDKVVLNSRTEDHEKYLGKMGFVKTEEGYEKTL